MPCVLAHRRELLTPETYLFFLRHTPVDIRTPHPGKRFPYAAMQYRPAPYGLYAAGLGQGAGSAWVQPGKGPLAPSTAQGG